MISSIVGMQICRYCAKNPVFFHGRGLAGENFVWKPARSRCTEKYHAALTYLKNVGVFRAVSGVLIGKPMDRQYEDEYKKI